MTPRVPETYLRARRNQIIDAACLSFVDKGLDKTTMPDICRAAGLSPGAIYNYFSGKEEILEACASKSLRRNTGMISVAASAEKENPLLGIIRAFIPLLKQHGMVKAAGFDLELYAESTRNPRISEILRANNETLLKTIDGLVKQMQLEGKLNKELDSRAISRFFIGMFYGLFVSKILDPKTDIDAAIAVCEAVVDGSFSGNKLKKRIKR